MSCISINLKKGETLIKIEDNATEEEIIKELKEKLFELSKLYQQEKTQIRVTGKVLLETELANIEKVIKEYIDVPVIFDTPKSLGLNGIVRSYKEEIDNSKIVFHRGSLRSGQRVEAEESIVVIGDVNAGAEIIAKDNIVVMGTLRGLAHAGAKGNRAAVIVAGTLDAVQIRISNIVREIDKNAEESVNRAYICVNNDNIEIKKW